MAQRPKSESKLDVRVQATTVIWAISVGLMAVTIPIAQLTQSDLIPSLVVVGAAISSAAVWLSGGKRQNSTVGKTEFSTMQNLPQLEKYQTDLKISDNREAPEEKEDVRVEVSVRIWKVAALMLFISQLPRPGDLNVLIPLSIIAAAGLTSGAIWLGGVFNNRSLPDTAQKNRLRELEERLANLETINNFERRLAEEALKRHNANQNAVPTGEVLPDRQSGETAESKAQRIVT